jgi:hypothetical protein
VSLLVVGGLLVIAGILALRRRRDRTVGPGAAGQPGAA